MAIRRQYRVPVFAYDSAANAWGQSYWGLSGKEMLDWLFTTKARSEASGMHGMYDHRPSLSGQGVRNVCWCLKPKVGEIPEDIVETYLADIPKYPSWMTNAQRLEYRLHKSWALLFFKWDSFSVKPYIFSTLLAKILANADQQKIGLAIVDVKDLYVNYNPVEWKITYDEEYPVEDLEAQKALYENWLTWSGFRRYYMPDKGGKLVGTPWYFRAPVIEGRFGQGMMEYPKYVPHPLKVSSGIFYPPGVEKP